MAMIMPMLMKFARNPYVMAAVVGGSVFGVFMLIDSEIINEMIHPVTLGLVAAVAYIAWLWSKGRIDVPLIGRRIPKFTIPQSSMTESAPAMRAMTTSMSDLLSPDEF